MGYRQAEPPPSLAKVFAAGTQIEPLALAKLEDTGLVVTNRQAEVLLPVTDDVTIVGHIDALVDDGSTVRLCDVKSQGPSTWEQANRAASLWDIPLFQKYLWQFAVYQIALGLESTPIVCRVNRETGEVLVDDVPLSLLPTFDDIVDRVMSVERAAEAGELPRCDELRFGCPFFYLHDEVGGEPVDDKVVVDDPKFVDLVRSWQEADAAEREAKERKDAVRAQLVELMGQQGWSKASLASGETVRLSTIVSKRIDQRRLQDTLTSNGFDLSPFMVESTTERLVVERSKK